MKHHEEKKRIRGVGECVVRGQKRISTALLSSVNGCRATHNFSSTSPHVTALYNLIHFHCIS